jgi:hypothetical protein
VSASLFRRRTGRSQKRKRALVVTIEDLVEDGDRTAARLGWTATDHSGRTEDRETIESIHVRDGMAVEHWGGRS